VCVFTSYKYAHNVLYNLNILYSYLLLERSVRCEKAVSYLLNIIQIAEKKKENNAAVAILDLPGQTTNN
jgi:hypothetical protein